MLTTDSGLTTLLAAATNKTDWATILNTALGTSKRIRCYRTSGGVTTEFRNVAIANTVTMDDSGLHLTGAASGTTVNLAADVSTGTCVLRIEGNSHWIEGSLGTTGADFIADAAFTTGNGFANKGITIGAPASLPNASGSLTIDGLQVLFGATGSPQPVTIAEQVYSGMSVGFAGATQTRYRCDPVTINGIEFTVFPGVDSDGRFDCWFYADWLSQDAMGTINKTLNRQYAAVDLKVSVNGTPQTLWDGTDTYTFNFQRGTALRWQSAEIAWNVTAAHIQQLQNDGKVMRHKCEGVFAATKSSAPFTPNIPYKPFKTFGTTEVFANQAVYVGDQGRSSASGGERDSVGLIHEWFARTVAEVGTHGNQAFATADRIKSLQRLAETGAQMFSSCGLINTATHRFLDPSTAEGGPYLSWKDNNVTYPGWKNLTQPDSDAYNGLTPSALDNRVDNSHPQNLFSYYAYLLSNDPFHLTCVQGAAITMVLNSDNRGNGRGTNGELNTVAMMEERGYFWGMKLVAEAWAATPNDSMPAPFRNKAFFNDILTNTLNLARNQFMDTAVHAGQNQTVISKKTTNFWHVFDYLYGVSGKVWIVPYMTDYGHMSLAHIRRMGYTAVNDVLLYYAKGAKLRADLGGNWYFSSDPSLGGLGIVLGPDTGTEPPYTDAAGYKAWYPGTNKVNGDIDVTGWAPAYWSNDPNYTHIFMGVLQAYKGLQQDGLVTFPDWSPDTTLSAFMAHLLNPTNITNFELRSKHQFDH